MRLKRLMIAMMKNVANPKTSTKKRGQGRPVSGENDVGRERLLTATEKLLRTLPPSRVTFARVAQEVNAHPALMRYYFGSRTELFLAVVDRVTAHELHDASSTRDPADAIAQHISKTVDFVRSASFMHRLMIEELTQGESAAARARVRSMNLDLVSFYRELVDRDRGRELVPTDSLFLHLVVLGASDFFSSAEPLIRELLPADADMDKVASEFQRFLSTLVMNGIRRR